MCRYYCCYFLHQNLALGYSHRRQKNICVFFWFTSYIQTNEQHITSDYYICLLFVAISSFLRWLSSFIKPYPVAAQYSPETHGKEAKLTYTQTHTTEADRLCQNIQRTTPYRNVYNINYRSIKPINVFASRFFECQNANTVEKRKIKVKQPKRRSQRM